jgi:hypothetical protein
VTLQEALKQAKERLAEEPGAWDLPAGILEDLVAAVEEHLAAQKKEADIIREEEKKCHT